MKLILAIVQDKDSNLLSSQFIDANIQATKLSTTGGFLKAGNTTFIIGIADDRVDEVLKIINLDATSDSSMAYPVEVQVGGATVFVLPIEAFHRF